MKNDRPNILSSHGKAHSAFLHAKGWEATKFLMQKLDCQKNEKVLELGFGTGATMVELASRNRETHFYGVEINPEMYDTATQRFRLCGVFDQLNVQLLESSDGLPFEKAFFDKIYCESVLGILEGDELRKMLFELRRSLKPDGMLLFNETIWNDETTKSLIDEINSFAKQQFGIIQSSAALPYLQDWKQLLSDTGFQVERVYEEQQFENGNAISLNWQSLKSRALTLWGKIKHGVRPIEVASNQGQLSIPPNIMRGVIIQSKASTLA